MKKPFLVLAGALALTRPAGAEVSVYTGQGGALYPHEVTEHRTRSQDSLDPWDDHPLQDRVIPALASTDDSDSQAAPLEDSDPFLFDPGRIPNPVIATRRDPGNNFLDTLYNIHSTIQNNRRGRDLTAGTGLPWELADRVFAAMEVSYPESAHYAEYRQYAELLQYYRRHLPTGGSMPLVSPKDERPRKLQLIEKFMPADIPPGRSHTFPSWRAIPDVDSGNVRVVTEVTLRNEGNGRFLLTKRVSNQRLEEGRPIGNARVWEWKIPLRITPQKMHVVVP